jgi:hypothetical protein
MVFLLMNIGHFNYRPQPYLSIWKATHPFLPDESKGKNLASLSPDILLYNGDLLSEGGSERGARKGWGPWAAGRLIKTGREA